MDRTKKALVTLLVIGALATVGVGTYATFTAQTTNAGNSVSTGTLVLSNSANSGTACLSTGGGNTNTNSNGSCSAFFTVATKGPGQSASGTLAIKNDGSLAASTYKVFSTACTDTNAAGETYHGTGSLCGVLDLYIQEYSDSAFTTAMSSCVYPASSTTACSFNSANTAATFASSYPSAASALALTTPFSAQSFHYYKVFVQVDPSATNSVQGRDATFDLNWYVAY